MTCPPAATPRPPTAYEQGDRRDMAVADHIRTLETRLAEAERLLREAEALIVDLARTAVPVPLMGGPTTVVGAIRAFLASAPAAAEGE